MQAKRGSPDMTPHKENILSWRSLRSIAAPPRDPHNDDDEDEEENEDGGRDEEREPPVIREPDEDEIGQMGNRKDRS